LLNEPGGATVAPRRASSCAITSFVEVFPDEPVMAMTTVSGSRRTTAPASAASAANPSATSILGPSTGRVTSAATAPRPIAAAT